MIKVTLLQKNASQLFLLATVIEYFNICAELTASLSHHEASSHAVVKL